MLVEIVTFSLSPLIVILIEKSPTFVTHNNVALRKYWYGIILLILYICFLGVKQLWNAEYFRDFDQFRFCFDWIKYDRAIRIQISKISQFYKFTKNVTQCSFWFLHKWNDMINQIVTTLKFNVIFPWMRPRMHTVNAPTVNWMARLSTSIAFGITFNLKNLIKLKEFLPLKILSSILEK